MKKFVEMFEAVFAATAFAEHGERDGAVKIADGSLKSQVADKKQLLKDAQRKRILESSLRPRI